MSRSGGIDAPKTYAMMRTGRQTPGIRLQREAVASAGKRLGGRIAVWLNSLFGSRAGGSFGILQYHRVTAIPRGVVPPTMNVSPSRMREQIDGLLRIGYEFWPLGEVIKRASAGETIPPQVGVITFDDGFENVYLHAWPLLKRLNVPATLFVATGYLDSPRPFPFDTWGVENEQRVPAEAWRPLSWAQCQEMEASEVMKIGTHSHVHRNFRGEPEELERDLLISLAVLQDRIGPGPRPFAFPFGSARNGFADAPLQEASRRAGVTCGLTTQIGLVNPRTLPFSWPRLEVVDSDDISTIKAKLEGWYTWMDIGREVFRNLRHALPT